MRMTAREAQATKASAQKLKSFGKCWDIGKTYTCFYPVFKQEKENESDPDVWDVLVGGIWGHKVNDFKGMGSIATFIPTTCDIDSDGNVVSAPDAALQFSKIASAYIRGQKDREMAEVLSKELPTEAMRAELIAQINDKYDTQKNMEAPKSAIGGLTYYISTEVLVVPRSAETGKPVVSDIQVASQAMADNRLNKLRTILSSESKVIHMDNSRDIGFLEVTYQYPANVGRNIAGQTMPEAVTPEYAVKAKFPDLWSAVESYFSNMSSESEVIMKRNYSYNKVSQSKLLQCIRNYVILNGGNLNYLDKEGEVYERLLKNIDVVVQFDAHKYVSDQIKEDFTKALEKYEAEHGEVGGVDTSKEIPENVAAPDIATLLKENSSSEIEAEVNFAEA